MNTTQRCWPEYLTCNLLIPGSFALTIIRGGGGGGGGMARVARISKNEKSFVTYLHKKIAIENLSTKKWKPVCGRH